MKNKTLPRKLSKDTELWCQCGFRCTLCALAACQPRHSTGGRFNVSMHTEHRQGAVTVGPVMCQNNNHLQNKPVILTDNFGKNKQPWLLLPEIFIAAAVGAVSSAVLPDRSLLFPSLSTVQSVRKTAAVICISGSSLPHETQCKPFTLIKIFPRANMINWQV